jgi:3-methyladenine DNA glycosylase AlkC
MHVSQSTLDELIVKWAQCTRSCQEGKVSRIVLRGDTRTYIRDSIFQSHSKIVSALATLMYKWFAEHNQTNQTNKYIQKRGLRQWHSYFASVFLPMDGRCR